MSKYTTEVRYICEHYAGLENSVGYNDVNKVISESRGKIFDFDYPIFDQEYRSVIETKILKHYYTREIGAESVGLWKLWLDTRMNEIMPYYNKLYESALTDFNPFYDTDITTKRDGNTSGVNNSTRTDNTNQNSTSTTERDLTDNYTNTTSTDTNNWSMYSDTPQGEITGLEANKYLTNATHDIGDTDSENNSTTTRTGSETSTGSVTNTGTVQNDGTFSTTDDYVEHVYGKRGGTSYSKLLEEYRSTIINIDLKIINELKDLFINLWGCV